ncbi:MAG: hypothetical protein HQ528_01840 [Candidatus Marinimicrobia bacterium]|nr:hypothetical protein [Candidatus Neomarinimicrobiota bacterium]
MIKYILYGIIFYLGYRVFKYISNIQIGSNKKVKTEKSDQQDSYSKLDIQDAEFKDIDE